MNVKVHGFVDFEWVGYPDCRWSTNIHVFKLFSGAINWMSRRQSFVALSTTENEYMATTHASKEAVSLNKLCS